MRGSRVRVTQAAPPTFAQTSGIPPLTSGRGRTGLVDGGVLPLAHFLDSRDGDAAAASVEVDERGAIVPTIYVRRAGEISEHLLTPHPLHEYSSDVYTKEIEHVLRQLPA